MIKKYIKKPSPVEAVQWNGNNVEEIRSFYTRKYRGARKATGFRAPNNMIQKGTNLIVYGKADTIINTIGLNDYIVFEDKFFKIVSKDRFEAEYVQLDEDNTQKPSDLSINNLIRLLVPKHIWHYIKRLENYGFLLKGKNSITLERDTVIMYYNNQYCVCFNINEKSVEFCLFEEGETINTFERVVKINVKNNNWYEAFNILVAIFPDSIKENYK